MPSFAEFCADYFQKYFRLHPADAIYYGIKGYDHLLNDYSDQTYAAQRQLVDDSLETLQQIPRDELDQDQAIDYALLEGRLSIQKYEHAKEDYRLKWPDLYLATDAIYILTVRETDDLAKNLLSRLHGTPDLVRQGIANFSRPQANPPRLWTEMSIQAAGGGIRFLETLPSHPRVTATIKDTAALQTAMEQAKSAIHDFTDFLERDLLPRSRGAYAVGEEHYNLLLKKKHFLDLDAQRLLTFGEDLFSQTKRELMALAEELAPGRSVEEVARTIQDDHPNSEEILPAYQKAMQSARQFVKDKKLVSFPAREELHVVHTPEFRRHEIPFAAYLSPSPKDPNQVGYYYVTPVDV